MVVRVGDARLGLAKRERLRRSAAQLSRHHPKEKEHKENRQDDGEQVEEPETPSAGVLDLNGDEGERLGRDIVVTQGLGKGSLALFLRDLFCIVNQGYLKLVARDDNRFYLPRLHVPRELREWYLLTLRTLV